MFKALRTAGLVLLLPLIWAPPALSVAENLPAPEKVVEDVFDQAVDAFMDNREAVGKDPRVAYELIDDILSPHVHFELMTRLILGRNARDATDEQMQRFISAFRENTIRTYSSMLSENVDTVVRVVEGSGKVVDISPAGEPDDRGRVTVRTLLHVQDNPIPVIYRMIATDDGWRVYDVVIENISFVTNYREEYGGAIRRDGMDQLISRLEERNRQAWRE
ncbi:MAG: ABC transporter substrate-binding protein [Aquisalimonadaceae bacterium]